MATNQIEKSLTTQILGEQDAPTDDESSVKIGVLNPEAVMIEPEDGGIAVPDGSDGITRYPSVDGAPLPADDVAKLSGNAPPEDDKEK